MTVKTWRCEICGDPYIGEDRPSHCPFCGALAKYIIDAKAYRQPEVGELTETEKNNIFEAIKLEVANSLFYFCASRTAKDMELQARFRALGKVESEHAGVLSKIVNAQKPIIDRNAGECPDTDEAIVKMSFERETKAVEHYKKFLEEAKDTRVRQVFTALFEIEGTHIDLAGSTQG